MALGARGEASAIRLSVSQPHAKLAFLSSISYHLYIAVPNNGDAQKVEEYYPSDRLLDLRIGSITQVHSQDDVHHYSTVFVGVDYGRSILTRLPSKRYLPPREEYPDIFVKDRMLEMRAIHDGLVIAFETAVKEIYSGRLLISSFPEMIEARRLRAGARFPCAISCDIKVGPRQALGAITNISHGGCQIAVEKNTDYSFIDSAWKAGQAIQLEVFFPPADDSIWLEVVIKSRETQLDGTCKLGVAFVQTYDCVEMYLESLQLDSVAPFFR